MPNQLTTISKNGLRLRKSLASKPLDQNGALSDFSEAEIAGFKKALAQRARLIKRKLR